MALLHLLQLDNLMLKGEWPDVSLKMCDFGYSKDEAGQSLSKSTCGTPEYMAPEVCSTSCPLALVRHFKQDNVALSLQNH